MSERDYNQGWEDAEKQDEIAFKDLDAKIAVLLDALIWCSAASDFQDGGVAREGFLKIVHPLINPSKK